MRIGIDITPMVNHPNTGIGRYVRGLVQALIALGEEHQYVLYYASPPGNGVPINVNGRVGLRRLAASKRRLRGRWLLSHLLGIGQDSALGALELFHAADTSGPHLKHLPMVSTVYDLTFHTLPQTVPLPNRLYLAWTSGRSLACSAQVITLSKAVATELVRNYGVPEEKLSVVYPGLSEAFLQPVTSEEVQRVRHKFDLPEKFLLFVGALVPRKDLETLVLAYRDLLAVVPVSHAVVLAGPHGESSGPVQRLVRTLGLQRQVHFTGAVPDEDLPPLYGGADLFVFPSLYEGFGFPVLEAMAVGTPVVCSNAGALPEVAGEAALFVAPKDVTGLTMAMSTLLENDELRQMLSTRGREQASAFSWRRAAQEVLGVYETAARATLRRPVAVPGR